MKNRLKIFPEPESIIKDEFLTFYCRLLTPSGSKMSKNILPRSKDADFDDSAKLGTGQAKVDRLTSIIGIFQNDGLDFSKNKAEGDDIIGDAYEYLMRNFATQSGKSKGQFYTPA